MSIIGFTKRVYNDLRELNKFYFMKETLTMDVYRDERGEIYINKIKGKEFVVSYIKAGVCRGGDYHLGKQYNLILKGKLEITLRQNNKDVVKEHGLNELIVIPANTPHLFKAITDAILIEWKTGAYKPQYYKPYRKIISEHVRKK